LLPKLQRNRQAGACRHRERRQSARYPFFCPQCGQHRLIADYGEKFNGDEAKTAIEQCLGCGFLWEKLDGTSANEAHARKLLELPDSELLTVLRLLFPSMSGLVTLVADKTGYSKSYTMRVLQGERTNRQISTGLVEAFRAALVNNNVGMLI